MKIFLILLLILVNSILTALRQIKSDDIFSESHLRYLNSIFSKRTKDIFPENPPFPKGTKHHLQPESLLRNCLKKLWDDAKTANDRKKLLDSLNNYVSNQSIQTKLNKFRNEIDLDTLISSITWCPGDLVAGPNNRANDPGDKF